MVDVALDVALVTLEVRLEEVLAVRQRLLAVAHTMALEVGLRYDVEPVLIAELIPEGGVRVVTGTYGVDVHLLHHHDVLQHALAGDVVAAVGIDLVAVRPLDEDGLTIDQQLPSGDTYVAEAHPLGDHFAPCLDAQRIEVGMLGTPQLGTLEGHLGLRATRLCRGYDLTRSITQRKADG